MAKDNTAQRYSAQNAPAVFEHHEEEVLALEGRVHPPVGMFGGVEWVK